MINLAFNILRRPPIVPVLFAIHNIMTGDNVDHLYPNDALMRAEL